MLAIHENEALALLLFLAALGVVSGVLLNFANDIMSVCVFLIVLILLPKLLTLKELEKG